MKNDVTFELYGRFIGETNLFARDQPADLEGPQETWLLTRDIVDQGCTILRCLSFVDPISKWRVQAVAALFRRILITGEAVRLLISKGLDEPALSTSRTMLELEMNLRLVMNDPSDRMARKLAFFHLVRGRRHFRQTTTADSGPCRSVIPFHADHRFQSMPISDSRACRSPWSERVGALENLL